MIIAKSALMNSSERIVEGIMSNHNISGRFINEVMYRIIAKSALMNSSEQIVECTMSNHNCSCHRKTRKKDVLFRIARLPTNTYNCLQLYKYFLRLSKVTLYKRNASLHVTTAGSITSQIQY